MTRLGKAVRLRLVLGPRVSFVRMLLPPCLGSGSVNAIIAECWKRNAPRFLVQHPGLGSYFSAHDTASVPSAKRR
jgi:hypothetical protein